MDYSKLSDFEINSAVAKSLGLSVSTSHSSIAPWVYCGHDEDGGYGWGERDYCNNPADAWPIIADKKICLAFDVFSEPRDGGGCVASPAYGWETERVRHDNPLRAAMIVFLMMKDANNGL